MRRCPKCKNTKENEEFYSDNCPYCIACQRQYQKRPHSPSHIAKLARAMAYLSNPNFCRFCSLPLLPKDGKYASKAWSKTFCNSICSKSFVQANKRKVPRNSTEKQRAHNRKQKKIKKQDRAHQRLLANYGPEIAADYKAIANEPCAHSKQRIFQIKQAFVLRHSGIKLTTKLIERLEDLNRACGFPLLNVGWHCLRCGVFHKDPRFFDVDHIIPRADGGSDDPANLQCLCPNCHRIKTVGLNGVALNESFKRESNSDQKPLQLKII